jgi:hypothetical protein
MFVGHQVKRALARDLEIRETLAPLVELRRARESVLVTQENIRRCVGRWRIQRVRAVALVCKELFRKIENVKSFEALNGSLATAPLRRWFREAPSRAARPLTTQYPVSPMRPRRVRRSLVSYPKIEILERLHEANAVAVTRRALVVLCGCTRSPWIRFPLR